MNSNHLTFEDIVNLSGHLTTIMLKNKSTPEMVLRKELALALANEFGVQPVHTYSVSFKLRSQVPLESAEFRIKELLTKLAEGTEEVDTVKVVEVS
jgi:hypothetical protein